MTATYMACSNHETLRGSTERREGGREGREREVKTERWILQIIPEEMKGQEEEEKENDRASGTGQARPKIGDHVIII